jgi:anti-sigma factor RsiW
MKPCNKNRKLITWLALDALEDQQARELRAHLESCEGCRGYLEEISNVTEKLAMAQAESDAQATESFHRRVVGALRVTESGNVGNTLVEHIRGVMMNWRLALPLAGAAVLLVVSLIVWRSGVPSPGKANAQVVSAPRVEADLQPTMGNYEMVANRSLEKLDELVNRQGNRNSPPAPIYTAATRLGGNAAD